MMKNRATKEQVANRLQILKEYLSRYKSGAYYKSSETAIAEIKGLYNYDYGTRGRLEHDLSKLRVEGYVNIETKIMTTAEITNGRAITGMFKKRAIFFKVVGDTLNKSFSSIRYIAPDYITYKEELLISPGEWIEGPDKTLIKNPIYNH